MKTSGNRIGSTLGTLVLSGWMAGTAMVAAQDNPSRPGPPPGAPPPPHMDGAPNEAPQVNRRRMAKERVAELHRAGKHEEAEALAQRLRGAEGERPQMNRERMQRQPGMRARQGERQKAGPRGGADVQPRMKIQKLRQAAELLQAAGYPDQAAMARKEIERIANEARRNAEKDKARRESPAKADDAMVDELRKLRRELDELRGQLRRMKSDAKAQPESRPHDADHQL